MPKSTRPARLSFLCLLFAYSVAGIHAQEVTASTPAKSEVYIVPFSHLDLFWAGTREECLARGNRIIAKAIGIAAKRPDFRFFLESDNFVDNYMASHQGAPELDQFRKLVKEGRIEIAPNWADIFLNQPEGEVIVRNLLYGTGYARSMFGVNPPVFHPGDIPGFPSQLPQILAGFHIPFMVMTRIGPADRSLFNWESPDGSKSLVWNAIHGYGWGIHLNLHNELTETTLNTIRKELDETRSTTSGPVYIHWGLDLWAPTDKLIANSNALNRYFPKTLFRLATPQEFFKAIAQTPQIPNLRGEIPLGWPHVIDGIPQLWQLAVPATNILENAEKFATINYSAGYADYPQRELDSLWTILIESMDHNHDGQGGDIGDQEKMQDSQRVIIEGGQILRNMLRNIAERIQIPVKRSAPIVVFNALSWKRDDLVKAHVTLFGDVSPADINDYKNGMRLVDESGNAVPFYIDQTSENISRALEITFIAQGVPALGYKTFFLLPSAGQESHPPASKIALDTDNDVKDPRRPRGKDVIENDFYRVTADKATGRITIFDKHLKRDVATDLEIVGVEERGTNNVQSEIETGRTVPLTINDTAVEENNAVRTVLKISGSMADIPVVQRLFLYRNLKRVDIENSLDWNEPRFIDIEQLIPVPRNVQTYYGVPFGANSVKDILPGSGPRAGDEIQSDAWQKYRAIQSWVFAGTSEWGLTVAADHQLIKVEDGLIRANMIRGQRYTSVKIVRDHTVTSMHFPAKGHYLFRYSLSSGAGDWKTARSYRAGQSFNNSLIAVSVLDDISSKSLPPSHSFVSVQRENLIVSALKKSQADRSLILRVYETDGAMTDSALTIFGKLREFRGTNLLEEDIPGSDQQRLQLKPFEIKTIRIQP